jgi:type IV secretory pathway VirB3-like protein
VGNLGPAETRKRMMFGAVMLAFGGALTVVLLFVHARGPLLLVLFFPFWLGVMGLLQGRAST